MEKFFKSGYLNKKSRKSARAAWKKRWFVLRSNQLAYYKNSKEYQVLQVFPLALIRSLHYVVLSSSSSNSASIGLSSNSSSVSGSASNTGNVAPALVSDGTVGSTSGKNRIRTGGKNRHCIVIVSKDNSGLSPSSSIPASSGTTGLGLPVGAEQSVLASPALPRHSSSSATVAGYSVALSESGSASLGHVLTSHQLPVSATHSASNLGTVSANNRSILQQHSIVAPDEASDLQGQFGSSSHIVTLLDAGSYEDAKLWIVSVTSALKSLFPGSVLDLSTCSANNQQSSNTETDQNNNIIGGLDDRTCQLGVFVVGEGEKRWWQEAVDQLHPGYALFPQHNDNCSAQQGDQEHVSMPQIIVTEKQSLSLPPVAERLLEESSEEDEYDEGDYTDEYEIEESLRDPISSSGRNYAISLLKGSAGTTDSNLQSSNSATLARMNSPFLTPLTNQIPTHSSYLHTLMKEKSEWCKRWFVLRGQNLMIYRDQSEYEVMKIISLTNMIDILPYGRDSDISRLSTQQLKLHDKIRDKGIGNTSGDEAMIPLQLAGRMLSDFCTLLKTKSDPLAEIDELRNAVWAEMLLSNREGVMYAMELVFADRIITLATSRFDLYEAWLLLFLKAYLTSHSF